MKERDRSSSSDRSSDSSRSSRSRSLSPPQLSPVDSEHSQHSLPPPDLFDPSQDMHYRSPEVKVARSPEKTEVEEAEEVCRGVLNLKAPVTTVADDIHKYFFIVFQRN